jgi:hypothetical protein
MLSSVDYFEQSEVTPLVGRQGVSLMEDFQSDTVKRILDLLKQSVMGDWHP